MKTRLLIILVAVIVGVIATSTVGTMEYQSAYNQNCNSDGGKIVGFLRCVYINEDFELPDVVKKARDLGVNNIMNAVDSEELNFDEKKEYIKIMYESEDNIPSLNIRIKDFPRNLEYGEAPTFTVIETGYANVCTSPTLEVYSLKQEVGHDHTSDDLIYKHQIVYSCPPFDKFHPILNFWDESNFPSFPVCEKEGRYLIVGDSGYELHALEEYYCGNVSLLPIPVESDRVIFQDKSLDYWKSLNEDQLREYNSKSDGDEFYYALGELLAKEYFLEKLVELNLVNVNDNLIIHTGFALQPDPPIIGFNTVVNATDGFSYVMHTSVNGNRLGEYFSIEQLVFEPHILSAIAENKPAPFTNKFGESPTIYIITEEGDDKLSSNDVIIDFDQTNIITFVNNSPNSVRIQEVGENKIDEIPKNSWRTKAIVPGESLTMQFNSTGFYEFNVKKITDYFPDYLEHHATGEIVVFTENMTDYTFAEGLLMGSTFIQDAPRPEIPWQSIGAGNNRGLEIGIVDSVIEAFPNAYEYYLAKAKSLIPFDVPITIEFSGPIRLD